MNRPGIFANFTVYEQNMSYQNSTRLMLSDNFLPYGPTPYGPRRTCNIEKSKRNKYNVEYGPPRYLNARECVYVSDEYLCVCVSVCGCMHACELNTQDTFQKFPKNKKITNKIKTDLGLSPKPTGV